mmetsp:Transcript_30355/g.73842  ORF Transcript_30355/g.73842 Transcript_30355/m.73842 type:complete len:308 (+) Transcript_30355:314-1237(+)
MRGDQIRNTGPDILIQAVVRCDVALLSPPVHQVQILSDGEHLRDRAMGKAVRVFKRGDDLELIAQQPAVGAQLRGEHVLQPRHDLRGRPLRVEARAPPQAGGVAGEHRQQVEAAAQRDQLESVDRLRQERRLRRLAAAGGARPRGRLALRHHRIPTAAALQLPPTGRTLRLRRLAALRLQGPKRWGRSVVALVEPTVRLDLREGEAGGRRGLKHFREEVARAGGEPFRDCILRAQDLIEESAHGRLVEGQEASEHHEEDDAARPDVRHEAVVPLVAQHLRRHVVGRAARRVQQPRLLGAVQRGEAEV